VLGVISFVLVALVVLVDFGLISLFSCVFSAITFIVEFLGGALTTTFGLGTGFVTAGLRTLLTGASLLGFSFSFFSTCSFSLSTILVSIVLVSVCFCFLGLLASSLVSTALRFLFFVSRC